MKKLGLPIDINKEVQELIILLKEAETMLAPGEEITPEIWETLKKIKETKS
jgi:hypothetical protein